MSFPMYLAPGLVSLYGLGNTSGISGLRPDNTNWKFATIYNVWDGGNINAQIGSTVMFNVNEIKLAIYWNEWPYTIIEEAKLAGAEISPP